MSLSRWLGAAVLLLWFPTAAFAVDDPVYKGRPDQVVRTWYGVVLDLIRHTPTYSPPVASRALGYLGVTAYEATASGSKKLRSMDGQLNGLSNLPKREAGKTYDEAIVMQAALTDVATVLFGNTGPTGQRVLGNVDQKLGSAVAQGVRPAVAERSTAYGKALAAHIVTWSKADGGAVVENLGFPEAYTLGAGSGRWVPTSTIALQQKPLLPKWGSNRPFAMPKGASCPLPPPPAYSEERDSAFYKEAQEVLNVSRGLTPEQLTIARFWSDDAMLSPTPPGHWLSIGLQIAERDKFKTARLVEVLMRVGVAQADAFIGCWDAKYQYDLLRPVTYIKKLMDKTWTSRLITPPFPEYPSGHSTLSGATATVLTAILGDKVAFEDGTHVKDGLAPRKYESFWAAAEEAGISRLYGGIHFRSAIARGLDQGRCVGAFAAALKTAK